MTAAPWLEPYAAGPWVHLLAGLGPDFPHNDASDADWSNFSSYCWRCPVVLIAAGVAAAVTLPLVLHYSPPKFSAPWPLFAGAGCLALACLVPTIILCAQLNGHSFAAAAAELSPAVDALRDAAALAAAIAANTVGVELDALYRRCPASVRASLGRAITLLQAHAGACTAELAQLAAALEAAAARSAALQRHGESAEGAVALCWALPAIVGAAACVAIAVPLAEPLGWSPGRRLEGFKLPWLCAGIVAPAVLLICSVSAAELQLGIEVGAFCKAPDSAVLGYVANTSFPLAEHSLLGDGDNPAETAIAAARAEMGKCVDWVRRFRGPVAKVCPKHSLAGLVAELRAVHGNFAKAPEIVAPANFYNPYHVAVHEVACGRVLSGLGWLVLVQMLLALLGLPALTLAAGCLLDGLTQGRAFKPLSRSEAEADGEEEHDFNVLYQVVYIFSAFIFAVGALMYIIPSTAIVRRISGTLLFACGLFLLTNSDLVVTYVRMKLQIGRFQENNAQFSQSLQVQATHVHALKKAAEGLKEVDEKFGGSVEQAMREVGNLKETARTNVAMCARQLCRLYSDREKDGLISCGQELDQSFEMIRTVFSGLVDGYGDREMRLRSSLSFNKKYQSEQGVKADVFARLVEATLREESPDGIPDAVQKLMDKEK